MAYSVVLFLLLEGEERNELINRIDQITVYSFPPFFPHSQLKMKTFPLFVFCCLQVCTEICTHNSA